MNTPLCKVADIIYVRFELVELEAQNKYLNHFGMMLAHEDESNIYLYKDNGELLDGFPLKGNSIIDVKNSDKDDKTEILTRLDNFSIVSYEIN